MADTFIPPAPEPTIFDQRWAFRLTAWLAELARQPVYTFEEELALDGVDGMAQRIFGIEGIETGYSAVHDVTVLTAPPAGKKRVLITFGIFAAASVNLTLLKFVGALEVILAEVDLTGQGGSLFEQGKVTIDGTNETIVLRINTGSTDVHWHGDFLEID